MLVGFRGRATVGMADVATANDVKKFALVNEEVARLHDDTPSLAVSLPATDITMDDTPGKPTPNLLAISSSTLCEVPVPVSAGPNSNDARRR